MSILAFVAGLVAMYVCAAFSIYRSMIYYDCPTPFRLCIIWPYLLFLPQYNEEDDNG